MVRARAPYMEWAKKRPAARIDLAASDLLACSLEDLPGARQAVDLLGHGADGSPPLCDAIAARYGIAPDRVATAGGCSGANFLAFAAILEAGDEVLMERPVYDPLVAAARMLGAQVGFFDRRFDEGYAIDPDRIAAAVTRGTRLIVLSNPHNPTGVLASEESLEALARLAEASGIFVLVDEVYQDTVFQGRQPPAATQSPALISTNGLTKAYGLSALRCGWALATPEIAERIRRARDVVDNYGPIPADRLAVLAFRHLDLLAQRARAIIETNAPLVAAFLADRPDLECVPSRSITAFPRLTGQADAEPFVRRLFERQGTAVVAGSFFGESAHFRISFGGSTEALGRGLEALAAALADREDAPLLYQR